MPRSLKLCTLSLELRTMSRRLCAVMVLANCRRRNDERPDVAHKFHVFDDAFRRVDAELRRLFEFFARGLR